MCLTINCVYEKGWQVKAEHCIQYVTYLKKKVCCIQSLNREEILVSKCTRYGNEKLHLDINCHKLTLNHSGNLTEGNMILRRLVPLESTMKIVQGKRKLATTVGTDISTNAKKI